MTWTTRLRLFIQRFWQPTSACLTCMPGNLANLGSLAHWSIALQTGLVTGILVLALSFSPARRLFRNRLGNASVVGCLTALGDLYAHRDHYGAGIEEAAITGAVSFALAWAAGWLFEDRGRRIRAVYSRLKARRAG